jgi:hypothetical protein
MPLRPTLLYDNLWRIGSERTSYPRGASITTGPVRHPMEEAPMPVTQPSPGCSDEWCSYRASYYEDGRCYCGIHAPTRRAEKEARLAEWEAQRAHTPPKSRRHHGRGASDEPDGVYPAMWVFMPAL